MSALSSMPATNCTNCQKLRAELHQLQQQQVISKTPHSDPPLQQPAPLILYQLQKGIKPPVKDTPPQRQPAASPTRSPLVKAKPKSSPAPSPSSSTSTPKQPPPPRTKVESSAAVVTTTISAGTQTLVDDLPSFALTAPSCSHCICCEVSLRSLSELSRARDTSEEQRRKLETQVGEWQGKLKAMREEIAALRAQESSRNSSADSSNRQSGNMSLAEKDELLLLRKQRDSDARLIQRLQMQIQILSTPSSSSSSSSKTAAASSAPSSSSSATGANNPNSDDWKRHQMEIRIGAEQALSRLQQLFPDQNIGK